MPNYIATTQNGIDSHFDTVDPWKDMTHEAQIRLIGALGKGLHSPVVKVRTSIGHVLWTEAELRTKTGRVLTDEDFEKLADEAEHTDSLDKFSPSEFVKALMRGNPANFQQGYTAENAVIAVCERFGIPRDSAVALELASFASGYGEGLADGRGE